MKPDMDGLSMRQAIFSMDLAVETVSVYLLCCAIADAGVAVRQTALEDKWNGSPSALQDALSQLQDRHILSCAQDREHNEPVYQLEPEKRWRRSSP